MLGPISRGYEADMLVKCMNELDEFVRLDIIDYFIEEKKKKNHTMLELSVISRIRESKVNRFVSVS
jgi:hypothetical protein